MSFRVTTPPTKGGDVGVVEWWFLPECCERCLQAVLPSRRVATPPIKWGDVGVVESAILPECCERCL